MNILPLSGGNSDWSVGAEGYTGPSDRVDFIQYRIVSPNYFATMGIPVVHGRAFEDADRIGGPRSAIISQSLAKKFWGDEDPIGRRLRPGRSCRDAHLHLGRGASPGGAPGGAIHGPTGGGGG